MTSTRPGRQRRVPRSRVSCSRRPTCSHTAAWPGTPRPREHIVVARFNLPPERPEVRVHINKPSAIRSVSAQRWGNAGEQAFQYIPFGGEIHAERRFGDLHASPPRRRLVVRNPALQTVLPCRHQRGHANALNHHSAMAMATSQSTQLSPRRTRPRLLLSTCLWKPRRSCRATASTLLLCVRKQAPPSQGE